MVSGLAVTVQNKSTGESVEHVFDRLPVLIGRDATVAGICLNDARVSKVHAALDMREDGIWIRDAESTNGTRIGGRTRIPPGKWTHLGGVNSEHWVEMGGYRLLVRARHVELRSITDGAEGHTSMINPDKIMAQKRVASGPPTQAATEEVNALIIRWTESRKQLMASLHQTLGPLAPPIRAQSVQALLTFHPQLGEDPQISGLLRSGQSIPPPLRMDAAKEAETASFVALRELAAWYLGPEATPTRPEAIRAFTAKLRSVVDELLLGYVPLVAGMLKLTRELSLDTETADSMRQPTNVSEFARRLLDWKDPSTEGAKSIRSNFADLSVHQVAMLNAVMRGVRALLVELSPATIEEVALRNAAKKGLIGRTFGSHERDLWESFKARFADLADEEQERFRILFGREFAEEYRQFASETRGQDHATEGVQQPSG